MYGLGLLIINDQFIVVKIKQNAFFSVGKNLPELNITCNNNRIKQYNMVELPWLLSLYILIWRINGNKVSLGRSVFILKVGTRSTER